MFDTLLVCLRTVRLVFVAFAASHFHIQRRYDVLKAPTYSSVRLSLFHPVVLVISRSYCDSILRPYLAPTWIGTLVQRHAHGVHLRDLPIEVRFEVPMRAKRLLDMTSPSVLRVQLDGLEVLYVVCWKRRNVQVRPVGIFKKGRKRDIPALKNRYRTVAVLRCTLSGCPLSTIRFAMTRVVSVFRKLPIATSSGAVVAYSKT